MTVLLLALLAVTACGSSPDTHKDAQLSGCFTALTYLLQDHTHRVTTSIDPHVTNTGIGYAENAAIERDTERVTEILSSECGSYVDATLLAELQAWPRENLIQSGVRKGKRRE